MLFAGTGLLVSSLVLVLIGNFAQIPLFLLGLRYGSFPAFISGTLTAFFIGFVSVFGQESGMFAKIFLNVLLWNAIPVAVLTHLALSHFVLEKDLKMWAPAGLMTSGLTVLGYMLIFSIPLMNSTFDNNNLDIIEKGVNQSLTGLPIDQADRVLEAFKMMVPFLPSVQVISWMLMIVFNGLIAQWILKRFNQSVRPSPKLIEVFMPNIFLLILAISGVIGYFLFSTSIGKSAANIAIITLIPYFMMGLGTLKTLSSKRPHGLILMIIACFLMIITPALTVLVAMLGIFEPWINLRNKLLKQE